MTSSMIPAAVDRLVEMLTAALPIDVYDGAPLQLEDQVAALYVGCDDEGSLFAWAQDWAGHGHVKLDEEFEVPCLMWYRTGDVDLKAARDALFAHWAVLRELLRDHEDLDLEPIHNVRADLSPAEYDQPKTPDGIVARIRFVVRVKARI